MGGGIGLWSEPFTESEFSKLTAAAPVAAASSDALPACADTAATYLIIVPESLKSGVASLASYRAGQGHRVAVVTCEQIYSKFPSDKAVASLQIYLANLYAGGGLKYVLLAGDSLEAGDGTQSAALVPTHYRDLPGVGRIPTDYPFTLLAGESQPPVIRLGRIPARTTRDLLAITGKIVKYEATTDPVPTCAFVVGEYVIDGDEYAEVASETLISAYCTGASYDVKRIYYSPLKADLAAYKGGAEQLDAQLAAGCSWLEFRGHGAADLWGGLLDARSAAQITTLGRCPIIWDTSCFTASFGTSANQVCIAESLLRNPAGGAVAYVGNTGHGVIKAGYQCSSQAWFYSQNGAATLGDLVLKAKAYMVKERGTGCLGFLHSLNLLGDPALVIQKPVKLADNGHN